MPQTIFQLVGRKKELTSYGRKLSLSLKGRFDGLGEQITSLALEFQSEDEAQLRIAGYRSLLRRVALKTRFKGSIEFLSDSEERAVDWLIAGKADLAISRAAPDSHELVAKKAFTDELVLVFPKKWAVPSYSVTKETCAFLAKRPFFAYERERTFLDRVYENFQKDFPLRPSRTFSDWPVIFEMLAEGKGWTVAPDSYLSENDMLTHIRLPKDTRNTTVFYILSRKSDQKISWLKTAIQDIQDIFQG
jgi:DNA-binding transcriptional LysR family regulator